MLPNCPPNTQAAEPKKWHAGFESKSESGGVRSRRFVVILPVQITFRNFPGTTAISEEITSRARKLETFYQPITSCRVLVEAPARHSQRGYPFHIRIDLTVPEGEIIVKRS